MPLPNFLIIGAAKSGTTSMHMYLGQHPDVYFPDYKEPNYFALAGESLPKPGPVSPEVMQSLIYSRSITDEKKYESIFENVATERAVGEASVRYLYFDKAPERISRKIPDVKMIAILRDPVSRLYSHYCMNMQYQLEPLDLMDALEMEEVRREAGWGWDWHYTGVGRYSEQLKRYYGQFDQSQIKVFLHDDFVSDPLGTYQEACRFLEIDDNFEPDMSKRGKVTSRPRNLAVDRFIHWPNPIREKLTDIVPARPMRRVFNRIDDWNKRPIPKLDPELKKVIGERFKDELKELGEVLDRPIPWSY
ncbi:sulfotransferase family protein [Haloferula sp.]|uniref:sulfotransferase family protein n=1 Tax=Haloferula sp. TaxID=2497595 RepID=UPI00329D5E6E